MEKPPAEKRSMLDPVIDFCLRNKLVVVLATLALVVWGVLVAPFDWQLSGLPRDPIPVDAIPDIGENQQIVFSEWMGRSPQDVEDQITYPLTVALLGIPSVRTIRSYSFFGFSSIYVIFDEEVDFYWSRTRILEKLNSLPPGTLPEGVQAALGPDATAMGQVFWYTLEGRDPEGRPAGGWDLHELRTIQDWYVRYALLSVGGIAEVASIGGFEQEYQIDVDPDAMRAYGVTLTEVFDAVKRANIDIGARTIEVNKVEYVIRGLGFIRSLEDLNHAVIKANEGVPIYVKNVAHVTLGPALRRGVLEKAGTEAVGGVVVARYAGNPLAAIKNVKAKIEEISPGLPRKTLADGTVSQVTIVPFYDRTGLIYETLGTLNDALRDEILITVIVVILMVMHLRSSILISGLLPLAILATFIMMKLFGVDANIVALSGIAIAIGAIVDAGIVICENILRRLDEAVPGADKLEVVRSATNEVGTAIFTAVTTTVVSFLPVFTMTGAEGKLFKPLAFTKTFALIASIVIALTLIPPFAHVLFCGRIRSAQLRKGFDALLVFSGAAILLFIHWTGIILLVFGVWRFAERLFPERIRGRMIRGFSYAVVFIVAIVLSSTWEPLGVGRGLVINCVFVMGLIVLLMLLFYLIQRTFAPAMHWCLEHKMFFLVAPSLVVLLGICIWIGFDRLTSWAPKSIRELRLNRALADAFPGMGREFMPPLDEGSYLFMPVTMPHASIGEVSDQVKLLTMSIQSIPEVEQVVGKLGRVESSLDPAPISMIEAIVNYRPEYITDRNSRRVKFKYDRSAGDYVRDKNGDLIKDSAGRPYRQWRDHIQSPDDIWDEIVSVSKLPGLTSAPKLQPIATRVVMLQTGMRAPMGIKVRGPDLDTIEEVGYRIEELLRNVEGVKAEAVIADRIIGKPYLEIDIDRERIARFGIKVQDVQDAIEVAIGGKMITRTVEGRERYRVRVRYMRELRDDIQSIGRILIPAKAMPGMNPPQIPLQELADINYLRGPQVIKSEDTFLVGYVLFDKLPNYAEVDVVENAQAYLREHLDPDLPSGVSYTFAGSYENQVRAQRKLSVILPLALFLILLLLYFQFRSLLASLIVFSGVIVAWAGGFIMIWLYGWPGFLDFSLFGINMRELFQIHPINLSVAVWVGFLALYGIADDNGVIVSTYIRQTLQERRPKSVAEIRKAVADASQRRVRPCLMTTATTMLALLPVLTSRGRGSDVMVPMAIPSFGGMLVVLITLFLVPTLYCAMEEFKFKTSAQTEPQNPTQEPADESV